MGKNKLALVRNRVSDICRGERERDVITVEDDGEEILIETEVFPEEAAVTSHINPL